MENRKWIDNFVSPLSYLRRTFRFDSLGIYLLKIDLKQKKRLQFPIDALGDEGIGFQSQTSCLFLPAHLHVLPCTSCALFLALARRTFRFDSLGIYLLIIDLKQKKHLQFPVSVYGR